MVWFRSSFYATHLDNITIMRKYENKLESGNSRAQKHKSADNIISTACKCIHRAGPDVITDNSMSACVSLCHHWYTSLHVCKRALLDVTMQYITFAHLRPFGIKQLMRSYLCISADSQTFARQSVVPIQNGSSPNSLTNYTAVFSSRHCTCLLDVQ